MQALFRLESPELKFTGVTLKNPHKAVIPVGITAIIGPTGAGKTSLANVLEKGRNFMTNEVTSPLGEHPTIRTIVFNDIHSLSGFKVEYYQQRYESTMNDEVPTVADAISPRLHSPQWSGIIDKLHLGEIADKRLNFLSSGELRKMLIVNMLAELPQVLILDNPFIGLDAPSRQIVEQMIGIIASQGISVLLLISDTADIPECVDAVLPISDMCIGPIVERGDTPIASLRKQFDYLFDFKLDNNLLRGLLKQQPAVDCDQAVVTLNNCTVSYGAHVLISDISWEIKRGECWALMGPNGSGKSTLLSLINADNPQAYSNDVSIFGRKRGAGTSIWEVKERIGFLSSELHLYYGGVRNTVYEVVSEGFNRVLGSFAPLTAEQEGEIDNWLKLFGLDKLRDRCFNVLSAGHQRLVLLLRALVRQPEMLILDEPVHGLDQGLKAAVRELVDALAAHGATIIYVTHNPAELPASISLLRKLS